jgi:hypothetical protein
MKIGKTDFSKEALSSIREMTFEDACKKHPSIHPKVIEKVQEGFEVLKQEYEKPKKSKKS